MNKSKKNIGALIGEYGAFIALVLLVIVISMGLSQSLCKPLN